MRRHSDFEKMTKICTFFPGARITLATSSKLRVLRLLSAMRYFTAGRHSGRSYRGGLVGGHSTLHQRCGQGSIDDVAKFARSRRNPSNLKESCYGASLLSTIAHAWTRSFPPDVLLGGTVWLGLWMNQPQSFSSRRASRPEPGCCRLDTCNRQCAGSARARRAFSALRTGVSWIRFTAGCRCSYQRAEKWRTSI